MRRYRRVTRDELDRVREMRFEGITWKEIGARTGRCPKAFRYALLPKENPFAQYLVHRGAGL